MKRLVGFPMESGGNICVEVEGLKSASETTRPVRVVGRRADAELLRGRPGEGPAHRVTVSQ
jgi:hypothetical protein